MRIALLTDTYPPFINGVSTSCYNLVQTLKKHGNEVLVITPRHNDGPLEFKDGIIYVPGIELKKLYGYRITSLYSPKVFKMIRDFHPEVIHNQTDSTIGQFAKIVASKLGVPIVYTYHTSYEDYTYYATHGYFDRLAKRIIRSYTINVADTTTEFITPSYKTKEYLRYAGSDIYINIIPTGINFDLFGDDKVDAPKQEVFKKEHGIGPDTKVFLILGRVAKEKSMDFSLKCFALYHERHLEQDIKMILVGGGPQLAKLKELVKNLEIEHLVDFIGPVMASEVPFYYHIADIYTSASVTETQGLTFMEAMASKTLVLARFDTNLSDTIIDNETGFFFQDEEDFIHKVERIFAMKASELDHIKEAAIKICEVYSLEKFYSRIMEVYNRAIRKFW
ncbi:MAG TPA: glycosyltransferase [Bacilli bacterium]|nr:glycosyltransferase [Bacilli bacterium]